MVMLPWFWFMQSVKLLMSAAQGPEASAAVEFWLYMALDMGCCACCSTGAAEEDPPPLNIPPIAWPIEDPTATPLYYFMHNKVSFLVPLAFANISLCTPFLLCPGSTAWNSTRRLFKGLHQGGGGGKITHAAVLAI